MPSAVLRLLALLVVIAVAGMGGPRPLAGLASANAGPDHLVISELVTGGTSASDELIELYNPSVAPLPLEGLELVYVSASGLTVSRRAAWELGAPDVPAGGHVLVAHELGAYASIADATYASGMAATGGSVALRIVGAASAIDAVGWGSAVSTWLEGSVAAAPPAGSSLERLPGGALGSTQDTDDNAADFVLRSVPGPENSASSPVPDPTSSGIPQPSATVAPSPTVAATPSSSPSASASLSPSPQPTASPSPGPQIVSIATARALPDGTGVTVEGVALTDSGFADGGGYLADESGGLAVLLSDGSFARGDRLRVSGSIDDRYAQRTLRATGAAVVVLGTAADPVPVAVATGGVGETVEGRLVRIGGTIVGTPTALSAGLAFEVDDGSGSVRLLVGSATGIDVSAWGAGFAVDAIGVVGQRDSSGTGISGYRVQPRGAADVLSATPAPTSTPTLTPVPTASPDASPEPSQPADVVSVAAARQLPKGASAVVRGVVTLAPGLVDPITAALQDATGAIVLRIGEDAGPIARGTLVEVRGTRSTLSGMETLRVTTLPRSLGASAEPAAQSLRTGDAGEAHEASLVVLRGGLVAAPRRSSAGTISFEIDDGSGPLRVAIGSSAGIQPAQLGAGTWIEVRGILGQETTGNLPLRGYRVWPRDASDLRVVAPATTGAASGAEASDGGWGSGQVAGGDLETLDAVGVEGAAGLRIGATLVVGPWEELGLGGLLWDGARLVGIQTDAGPLVAELLRDAPPPVAIQASGLHVVEVHESTGIAVAGVPDEPGSVVPSGLPPSPPLAAADPHGDEPRWVTLVGRLDPRPGATALLVGGESVALDHRCEREPRTPRGTVSVTGILVGEPQRLIAPCGGILPAPLLLRDSAARHSSQAPVAMTALGTKAPEAPNPLPVVLLLLAAATLGVGAALARWASRDGTPGRDAGEVPADEGAEAASPPTLTLVPLPRERAP